MKVNFLGLTQKWQQEKVEILSRIEAVSSTGVFIDGEANKQLEQNFGKYFECDPEGIIAVNSGTDALALALATSGLKPGDQVLTVSNSFLSSTSVLLHLRLVPVFVDIGADLMVDYEKIEEVLRKYPIKAMLLVHLTGKPLNMPVILRLAQRYSLVLIEDCAQAIGSKFDGQFAGILGDFGCFSTHPLKNLSTLGDGGFIISKNITQSERIRRLRNHGLLDRNHWHELGFVSRMSEIQASVLDYRLSRLDDVITQRRKNATQYFTELSPLQEQILLPKEQPKEFHTYHLFVIQVGNLRDRLKSFLEKRSIETKIHYPVPIHQQPAIRKFQHIIPHPLIRTELSAQSMLSLPIHEHLSYDQISYVCDSIKDFFQNS